MEIENSNNQENLVKELSLPLFKSKGWLKLLGILMIVYGGFMAISIVGLIIAWLPIWLGALLYQSAGKIETAHISGDKQSFIKAQQSLGTYFTIYGVLAIIGILVSIIALVIVLIVGIPSDLNDMMRNDLMQNDLY